MIHRIILVSIETELNCWDLSNQVQYVRKTKQDNDMTNRTSTIYIKNKTEQL